MAEISQAMSAAVGDRHTEAVENYRQLLRTDPNHAEVYVNIGIALKAQGRFDEAIAHYKQAIYLKPQLVEAHYNLANLLKEQERYAEAIENYTQAVRLKPDFYQAYYNLGNTLRSSGQFSEAIDNYRQAVRLKGDYTAAYNNLAMTLKDVGRIGEAIENYREAIRLKPDYAEAHNNLGIAFKDQGRLAEAVESYRRAVSLRPHYAEAHNNMGIALHASGEHDRALECFEQAIQLAPDHAQARWNRSLVLLLKGRFTEGWEEYQWRRRINLATSAYPHTLDKPRWDGKPFAGKRLLVHYEQGLGDNLQFVRYLPTVKQLGGTVVFETPRSMYGLLRAFDGIDELVEASPERPPDVEFDSYTSLMDLPGIFGTTLETIPADVPYIYADSAKVEHWRGRLCGSHFKVGIVWAGRPTGPNEVLSLQHRSCGLKHFEVLADVAGVALYGLQKGPPAAQVDELSEQIIVGNLAEQFDDFADTAGVIENLDLVICIDTSVAHLAGAMGKPVWVLLKSDADWRWLLDRQDSPWYPTMRLFRQRRPGDWSEVLSRVAGELRNRVDAWGKQIDG
jgi:tetratricopeptide (TPR) repeat protein